MHTIEAPATGEAVIVRIGFDFQSSFPSVRDSAYTYPSLPPMKTRPSAMAADAAIPRSVSNFQSSAPVPASSA